jgi:eukaryotic-like serine/threonine-protein kinase
MDVTTEIRHGVLLADRFRVHGRLGSGGTATVFLAEDCVLGRDVAIKRLHAHGSDRNVRRFQREARLGASLIHPNLVTVFDTISGEDGVLIVMEHVQGRPLSDQIPPEGMAPEEVLEVLRPVASALDYAHQHGVVHRDVKPANILIGEDRTVKLVDLGTATGGKVTQITAENEVTGTLAYIAPERLAGDSVGEPAADVYSLAVVAFEALTGHRPHRAETPGELLNRVLNDPLPDLRDVSPDAPPGLARALNQGMDPDPDRRQTSPGALVRDLEAATTDRAAAPVSTETVAFSLEGEDPGPPLPPLRSAPGGGRSRWLLPASIACVAALLAVGIWLAVSGGGGEGGASPERVAQSQDDGRGGGEPGSAETAPQGAQTQLATAGEAPSPDPAAGAALNDEGYSLIQEGRYEEAVPVLQRAVRSFPEGTTDINYAYALFNLGNALRLSGSPQEAIPILKERLQIPNQTDTVRAELAAARTAAGA